MNSIELKTSARGNFCGAHAVGHSIVLLWDQLSDDSAQKIIDNINLFYFNKTAGCSLTKDNFIKIVGSMCSHDIQLVMSLPLINMIRINNHANNAAMIRKNLKNNLTVMWEYDQTHNESKINQSFLKVLREFKDSSFTIEFNYTQDNFIQQLNQLEDNRILRALNIQYCNLIGLSSASERDLSYDYPQSYFSGDQLYLVLDQLGIDCEIYLKTTTERIPITQNVSDTSKPIVRLVSDGTHWQSLVDFTPKNITINEHYKQKSVLLGIRNDNDILRMFKKIVTADGVEHLPQMSLFSQCLTLGKGLCLPRLPQSTNSSEVISSDTTLYASDDSSSNSTSPTFESAGLALIPNDIDQCKWDKLYQSYRELGDVDDNITDAMESLNTTFSTDNSDEFILRPNVKRLDLDFDCIKEFLPQLVEFCDKSKDKSLYKFQVLSILYNLQSVKNGKSMFVAMGTGTGKSIIYGIVIHLLLKKKYNVFLFEKSENMKTRHKKEKDYPFTKEGFSGNVFEKLEDFHLITQNSEGDPKEGKLIWSTIDNLKKELKSKDLNYFKTIFSQSSEGTLICIDECHKLLSQACKNADIIDVHSSPDSSDKDAVMMNTWFNINQFSLTSNLSIQMYSATPGSPEVQVKLLGAAFGSEDISRLIKKTSSSERFPVLYAKGAMTAAYMRTVKGFEYYHFLDDAVHENMDALDPLMGYSSTTSGMQIRISESYENIKHLSVFLRLAYFISVSDKTASKKTNSFAIGNIMRKTRFIESIKIMLLFICDLRVNSDKYLDRNDDVKRSAFYIKEFNEEPEHGVSKIVQILKEHHIIPSGMTTDQWVDHFKSIGFDVPTKTVGFIKKYNLFNEDGGVELKAVNDLLPAVNQPQQASKKNLNLKTFFKSWMEHAYQQTLNSSDFKVDVDGKMYGKENPEYKMLIMSEKCSTGVNLVSKGKQVTCFLLDIPSSSQEMMQLSGRFNRMSTIGDDLAMMCIPVDPENKWLTLYDLQRLSSGMDSQMSFRAGADDSTFTAQEIFKLTKCIEFEGDINKKRIGRVVSYFKNCRKELFAGDNQSVKRLLSSHYNIQQTKQNETLSLFMANLHSLSSKGVFERLKNEMIRLHANEDKFSSALNDKYYYPSESDPQFTIDTKMFKLSCIEKHGNFLYDYFDALLKCNNLSNLNCSRIRGEDIRVISFRHAWGRNQNRLLNILVKDIMGTDHKSSIFHQLFTLDSIDRVQVAEILSGQNYTISTIPRPRISVQKEILQVNEEATAKNFRLKLKTNVSATNQEGSAKMKDPEKSLKIRTVTSTKKTKSGGENTKVSSIKSGKHNSGSSKRSRDDSNGFKNTAKKAKSIVSDGKNHDKKRTREEDVGGVFTHNKKQKTDALEDVSSNVYGERLQKCNEGLLRQRQKIYQDYTQGTLAQSQAVKAHVLNLDQYYENIKPILDASGVLPLIPTGHQGKISNFTSILSNIIEYSTYMFREIEEKQGILIQKLMNDYKLNAWDLVSLSQSDMGYLVSNYSAKFVLNDDTIYNHSLLCAAIESNNMYLIEHMFEYDREDIQRLTENRDTNTRIDQMMTAQYHYIDSSELVYEYPLQTSFHLIANYLSEAAKRDQPIDNENECAYLWRQISIYQVLKSTRLYKTIKQECYTSSDAKTLFTTFVEHKSKLDIFKNSRMGEETKVDVLYSFVESYLSFNPKVILEGIYKLLNDQKDPFDILLYLRVLPFINLNDKSLMTSVEAHNLNSKLAELLNNDITIQGVDTGQLVALVAFIKSYLNYNPKSLLQVISVGLSNIHNKELSEDLEFNLTLLEKVVFDDHLISCQEVLSLYRKIESMSSVLQDKQKNCNKYRYLFDFAKQYLVRSPVLILKNMIIHHTSPQGNSSTEIFSIDFMNQVFAEINLTNELLQMNESRELYELIKDKPNTLESFKKKYRVFHQQILFTDLSDDEKIAGLMAGNYKFTPSDICNDFPSSIESSNDIVQLIIPTHEKHKVPSKIVEQILSKFKGDSLKSYTFHLDICLNRGIDYDIPTKLPKLTENCISRIKSLLTDSRHSVTVHSGQWSVQWSMATKLNLDKWNNRGLADNLKVCGIIDEYGYVTKGFSSNLHKLRERYDNADQLVDEIKRVSKCIEPMTDEKLQSLYNSLDTQGKSLFKLKNSNLGKPAIGVVRDYLLHAFMRRGENIKLAINCDSDWVDNQLPLDRLILEAEQRKNSPPLFLSLCYKLSTSSEKKLSPATNCASRMDLEVRSALSQLQDKGNYLGYSSEVALLFNQSVIDIIKKSDVNRSWFGSTDEEGMNFIRRFNSMPAVRINAVNPIQEEGSCVHTEGQRFELLKAGESWEQLNCYEQLNRLFSLSQSHADAWKLSQIISWNLNCQQHPILFLAKLFDCRTLLANLDSSYSLDSDMIYQTLMKYSETIFKVLQKDKITASDIDDIQQYFSKQSGLVSHAQIILNIRKLKDYLTNDFNRCVTALKFSMDSIIDFIEKADKSSILGQWKQQGGYVGYYQESIRQPARALSRLLTDIIDLSQTQGVSMVRKKIHSDQFHLDKQNIPVNDFINDAIKIIQNHKRKTELLNHVKGQKLDQKIGILKQVDQLGVWLKADIGKVRNFFFPQDDLVEFDEQSANYVLTIYNKCNAELHEKIMFIQATLLSKDAKSKLIDSTEFGFNPNKVSIQGLSGDMMGIMTHKIQTEYDKSIHSNALQKWVNYCMTGDDNTTAYVGKLPKEFIKFLLKNIVELKGNMRKALRFYEYCVNKLLIDKVSGLVSECRLSDLMKYRDERQKNANEAKSKALKNAALKRKKTENTMSLKNKKTKNTTEPKHDWAGVDLGDLGSSAITVTAETLFDGIDVLELDSGYLEGITFDLDTSLKSKNEKYFERLLINPLTEFSFDKSSLLRRSSSVDDDAVLKYISLNLIEISALKKENVLEKDKRFSDTLSKVESYESILKLFQFHLKFKLNKFYRLSGRYLTELFSACNSFDKTKYSKVLLAIVFNSLAMAYFKGMIAHVKCLDIDSLLGKAIRIKHRLNFETGLSYYLKFYACLGHPIRKEDNKDSIKFLDSAIDFLTQDGKSDWIRVAREVKYINQLCHPDTIVKGYNNLCDLNSREIDTKFIIMMIKDANLMKGCKGLNKTIDIMKFICKNEKLHATFKKLRANETKAFKTLKMLGIIFANNGESKIAAEFFREAVTVFKTIENSGPNITRDYQSCICYLVKLTEVENEKFRLLEVIKDSTYSDVKFFYDEHKSLLDSTNTKESDSSFMGSRGSLLRM